MKTKYLGLEFDTTSENDGIAYIDENELAVQEQHMTEWLQEIIDMTYGKKPFDADTFENALDELSVGIDVDLPSWSLKLKPTGTGQ